MPRSRGDRVRVGLEPLESRVLLSTYYVSPGGSDAAAGTEAAPWKTLPFAQGRASAGDTLVLRGGTYPGGLAIATPALTLRNYPGERPLISSPTAPGSPQAAVLFDVTSSGSKLQGLDVSGGYEYAVKLETDWAGGAANRAATNITIEDCVLHDSGRDVVKVTPGCDGFTVRRTEIYNSGRRDASNAEGIDNVNGDRMLVQDCHIHDIATNGLYAKGGASGCVVERNRIERTGYTGVSLGFIDTDAPWFDAANTSYYESIDSTVRNNVISDTVYAGVGLYGALRPRVYNNTLVNVAKNGQGGVMLDGGEVDTDASGSPDAFPACRDVAVSNNLVVMTTANPAVLVRAGGLAAGTLSMSTNRYFRSGGAASFSDEDRGYRGGLAGWKAAAGTDSASTEGDPLLDPATLRLTAQSPAVDAATDLSAAGFADDLDRQARPAGPAWDVGADEYGGAAPGPDVTAPSLSGIASSGVTVSAATISWTTNEPADSQVEYGTSTSYGSSTTLDSASVTSHSQSLSGLAAGTVYHYRVKSRDAAGNLAVSPDRTFTTAAAPDTTAPTISGVASSAVSAGGATISWATNEASDTQVEYGTTTAYGSSTTLAPAKVTSHGVGLSGLSPNTTYHFRVKSRDAAGNLAVSGDFTFTTTAAADTTAPTISGVGASDVSTGGAAIGWTTDEAADTQVEYGTTTAYGSTTPLIATLATVHDVALSGMAAGTTYHYRVKSRDAAGNLSVSGDFTFTTTAVTPPPVGNESLGSFGLVDGRKAKLTFTDADGTVITATLSGGGSGQVFLNGDEVELKMTGTGERSVLVLTAKRGTGDGRVSLGAVHVGGALRGVKATTADLRGTFLVNGALGSVLVGNVLGGTIAAAGSIAALNVLGGVSNGRVLAGLDLGSDDAPGGGGDAADTAAAAVIRSVRVRGVVAGSVFAAGVTPGAGGTFGDGDDTVAGGTSSGVLRVAVSPTGNVDAESRFVAGLFGRVQFGRQRVDPGQDARFFLLG